MRTTTTEQLSSLQSNPSNIRNICILAHVDHGKTTLADSLVANNGIISQRMAGKLRYLDSREDEQLRGITMKSSAISLRYTKDGKEHLINLIDSPGHIDFSSEVSTAVRLCDGAIVVVDVVEGVCPQTVAVLRQAWLENIRPVLLLNKIDRLMSEWKMTPLEAHVHLMQVLEQVNAVTGELFASEVMEKASLKKAESSVGSPDVATDKVYDWSAGLEEVDDSNIYFSPDQGNVVFGSALDGWGFCINQFAEQWATKLGFNAAALKKTLWGDFYLEMKTKRIRKGAQAKGKKPMFVQFVLDQLWAVYDAVVTQRDKEKTEKIVKSLNVKISARDTRQNDPRVLLQAICGQWLPISLCVLDMVVTHLPSPLDVGAEKVEKLLCPVTRSYDSLPPATQALKEDFLSCSPEEDVPVIVFISKMFSMDKSALPKNRARPLTEKEIAERREKARIRHAEKMAQGFYSTNGAPSQPENGTPLENGNHSNGVTPLNIAESEKEEEEDDERKVETGKKNKRHETDQVFIAFARVYSGTIKSGQKLYILGPKHDPAKALDMLAQGGEIEGDKTVAQLSSGKHITVATVDDLYMFMGRELESLDSVPAGNVLGIGGLEEHVLKSATMSSTVACPAFTEMHFEAAPIVRVAVEPKHATDIGALMWGMRLLNQSDSSVQVLVQETGEHVIIAAGEVHLQKCLDDLQKLYAKIEVTCSKPIVPFRETIIEPPKVDRVNEAIIKQTIKEDPKQDEPENGDPHLVTMTTPNKQATIQIRALSLPEAVTLLLDENKELLLALFQHSSATTTGHSDLQSGARLNEETKQALRELKTNLETAFETAGKEWNLAVDEIWALGPRRNGTNLLLNRVPGYVRPTVWSCVDGEKASSGEKTCKIRDFDNSIVNGFHMATLAGPLCQEPMRGVAFVVENWEMLVPTEELQGLTISTTNDQLDTSNKTNATSNKQTDRRDEGESEDEEDGGESEDEVASNPSSKVSSLSSKKAAHGPFSGQLMSTSKEGFKRAFQAQPQRLMAAMYTCSIQVTTEVLGKMYAVIGKRQGRILNEELLEGSSMFKVTALLPVVESFGFAEEMRKRTSGLASPQLRFTHWEIVDVDPFWVPTTEEEYLHFGEKADSENIARLYMNKVRRRKGLPVNEKIVEFGEKQRTLSKNK